MRAGARREVVAASVLIAVGAAYAVLTAGLPNRTLPNTPGPSFFPWLIAGAVLLLSIALLAQGLLARGRPAPDRVRVAGLARRGIALCCFAVYLAVLPTAGFLWASIPFFAALAAIYGGRGWAVLGAASLVVPAALFYLFREIFRILLPEASW